MVVAKVVDGIEMGVLDDGTPFLTGAGLAKACGVPKSVIYERAKDWKDGKRDGKLARLLQDAGFDEPLMYTPIDNGRVYAFTDSVCTLVIEYYALENNNPAARQLYRVLARQGLRDFVYKATGFDPRAVISDSWSDFHERLLLSTFPSGYFSVFRELADFLLRAIQGGLLLDKKNVPDISVGRMWSSHWESHSLANAHGERIKHVHNYPDHYPQAKSNPQDIWVYPVEALGAFRRWLDETYIPESFPTYLNGKVKQRVIDRVKADMLLVAVTPALLESDV